MANMEQKGLTSESDISQEISEIMQPLLAPESVDSSSIDLHQQMKDDIVIDIEKKTSRRCIYRVPPMIRKLKKDAYTPVAVSIGPFHYRDKRLQDMEEYKQVLFERFKQKAQARLDEMVSFVKDLEPRVRASYSENIKLTKEELVKLVLVDAAFIIELFTSSNTGEIRFDAKLSHDYLRHTIKKDLLLLENQLPFFLIEDLFNRTFPLGFRGNFPSFLQFTYSFFGHYNKQNLEPEDNPNIKHFTDLLRLFYLPKTLPKRCGFQPGGILLYNANELQEAGVKFKSIKSNCLLDLNFSGNVLEIPETFLDDGTEFLFRNMIALEHCHYPFNSYIFDYALVMDCLINTDKDVDVLIHNKIIHNGLGDTNGVARLFSRLGKHIVVGTCSDKYLNIFKDLNEFYQNPCHNMKATLRRDYCNTPWKTVATIVGIIVILLTIIQTIISILQVVLM